jgi:hypothetical protein
MPISSAASPSGRARGGSPADQVSEPGPTGRSAGLGKLPMGFVFGARKVVMPGGLVLVVRFQRC